MTLMSGLEEEFNISLESFAEENYIRGYQLGLEDAYKAFTGKPEETAAESD